MEEARRSSAVERAMTSGLPDRHFAQFVHAARQLHFLLPIEVGQIEERELAIGKERTDHELVFGYILRLVLGGGTEWIGSAAAVDRHADQAAIRGDDVD